jgi:hypothetical protein
VQGVPEVQDEPAALVVAAPVAPAAWAEPGLELAALLALLAQALLAAAGLAAAQVGPGSAQALLAASPQV